MFKVGDNAVYPAHGVAVVKRIEERDVGGKKKNVHKGKPEPKKHAVVTLVERSGEVRAKHVANRLELLRRRCCGIWKVQFDRLPLRILMAQLAHVVGCRGILLRTCIFSSRGWGRETQQAEDEEGTKGETKMRTHGGTSHDQQNDPLRRYHCQ